MEHNPAISVTIINWITVCINNNQFQTKTFELMSLSRFRCNEIYVASQEKVGRLEMEVDFDPI